MPHVGARAEMFAAYAAKQTYPDNLRLPNPGDPNFRVFQDLLTCTFIANHGDGSRRLLVGGEPHLYRPALLAAERVLRHSYPGIQTTLIGFPSRPEPTEFANPRSWFQLTMVDLAGCEDQIGAVRKALNMCATPFVPSMLVVAGGLERSKSVAEVWFRDELGDTPFIFVQ